MPKKSELNKVIAKLPAKDIAWVHCTNEEGCEWVITSNPDRSLYYLYRFVPGGYALESKGKSPMDFYDTVYPPEQDAKPTRKRK